MVLGPGTRLGAYEVLTLIGVGGMGEVYRATDTKLHRDVAIKVLPAAAANDPERRARFEREAQAVAALNHPNIVTVHSVETVGDVCFIAMELVDGRSLADLIPRGGLSLNRLLSIAIPVTDAVAAAHQHGITHRDLKPANIIVGDGEHAGRVKVLDFGLAKLADVPAIVGAATTLPTAPITGEGRILGTVAYMSPEQAEGKPIDPRSDLFSLGVILYEMATGQRPFTGETSISIISSIVKDTPKTVTEFNPALPREFARIIRRALAKDPEHRYQTAKDLRNDLQTLRDDLASGELSASPVPPGERRGLRPAMYASLGVASLAVALSAVLYLRSSAVSSTIGEISVSRVTSSGKAAFASISPDGRYIVHVVVDRTGGGSSLWVHQTKTGTDIQISPPSSSAYIGLTFSPDGEWIYTTRFTSNSGAAAFRRPVLGGDDQLVVSDVDSPLAISPDGKRYVFMRGAPQKGEAQLVVGPVDGSEKPAVLATRRLPDAYPLGTRFAWSPDGKSIAVPVGQWFVPAYDNASTNSMVVIVDAATGTERTLTTRFWDSVSSVDWRRDNTLIVAGNARGTANSQLWRVSVDTGAVSRITSDLNDYRDAQAAVMSPSVVTILRNRESTLSAGAPDHLRSVTEGARYDGQTGLAWTRDGRIVFTAAAEGHLDLWMTDTNGRNPARLTSDTTAVTAPCGSADGQSIVFLGEKKGTVGLWRQNLSTAATTLLDGNAADHFPFCDLTNPMVYFSRSGEIEHIYRVSLDGGPAELLPLTVSFLGAFGISPDGHSLLTAARAAGRSGWLAAVRPLAESSEPRTFDILNVPINLAWTPRGDAITFVERRRGPEGIWNQPVDGGPPVPLVELPNERIYGFAWARDGQLAVAHGRAANDVVLISGVR